MKAVGKELLPECSVDVKPKERRRLKFNPRMAIADHDRQGQATHKQYKSRAVAEFISVSPSIIDTYKHENVKFS